MTSTRPELEAPRQPHKNAVTVRADSWAGSSGGVDDRDLDIDGQSERDINSETSSRAAVRAPERSPRVETRSISPLRKAAIVLVSLDQSLASQLLSHLDRTAVEMVTWEIARLDRIDPAERALALEEFYSLGLRRLGFVFDDLVKMNDPDIRAAFDAADSETWAVALAGAAANVRAKVLAAVPIAVGDRLNEQLNHLGPFRLSDSEAAQVDITERLRRLYDQGKISLPEPSGQDDVLV
jgi:flagellar motor switch protein FliG